MTGRKRKAATPAQQLVPGVDDVRAEWAEHDACFTPGPVVRQGLAWLAPRLPNDRRIVMLDPCAGGGVFGQQARLELGSRVEIHGVEPRASESGAARHYDRFARLRAQDLVSVPGRHGADLVVTNPPWWCWAEIFRACWPLVVPGGWLAVLGPSSWGHSDEPSEGVSVFDDEPPRVQLRIRGRVAFNGGRATDNRKCSWWIWRNVGARGLEAERTRSGGWWCENLPALTPAERSWVVRPGTEP